MAGTCRMCSASHEHAFGFCSRCGALQEHRPVDEAVTRLRNLSRMIRTGVWRHENCHLPLKKQIETIQAIRARAATLPPVAAMEGLIRELQIQSGAVPLGNWVKCLQLCLELSQIESEAASASLVGEWETIRTELQRSKQLYQGIMGLQKSATEQSLSRSKLLKPLTTVAEQAGYTLSQTELCIRHSFRMWPHLAVDLELVTQEVAARESSVTKAQGQIKQENYGAARQLLEAVLKVDSSNLRALETLAGLNSRTGRKAVAIPLLEQALRAATPNPLTWNNYAWLLATVGESNRFDEAALIASQACDVLPVAMCFDTLAECHEKRGDLVAAFAAVREGLEDDPHYESLLVRLERLQGEWSRRHPALTGHALADEDRNREDDADNGLSLEGDLEEFDLGEDSQIIVLDDSEDASHSSDFELELCDEDSADESEESAAPSASVISIDSDWELPPLNMDEDLTSPDDMSITPRGDYSHATTASAHSALDPVDCSVFAPPSALIGDAFLVQVFAHLPEQAEQAARAAIEFDVEAQRRGATSLGTRIARGSTLSFELLLPGLTIDDPAQHLVWQGRANSVQFAVEIPADSTPRTVIGTVIVSQNSIPVGTIKFKLKLTATPSGGTPPRSEPVGEATRYRKAFVSYASGDRPEVLRRVQMLAAVGIQYFQDVLNLDPGQRWEQELYHHIDDSDVMFLFWSSRAKESPWVAREWQYARDRKGDDFIRPVIIEGPPVIPPPAELSHLHFNDRVLYFLQAESMKRSPADG